MDKRNDTYRLDWTLIHQPVFDSDWKSGRHWIVFRKEGRKCLAEGQTFRDCIDRAMYDLWVYVD
jgi:hypothetical protein